MVVKSDLIAEAVIAAAKKHKCDLIVDGLARPQGIKRLLLGSEPAGADAFTSRCWCCADRRAAKPGYGAQAIIYKYLAAALAVFRARRPQASPCTGRAAGSLHLPMVLRGSSGTTSSAWDLEVGQWPSVVMARVHRLAVELAPGLAMTTATPTSPKVGCGTPTSALSATPACR